MSTEHPESQPKLEQPARRHWGEAKARPFHRRNIWLAAILLTAAVLRFWAIHQADIFAMDEARYLLDSEAKAVELRHLATMATLKWEEIHGGEPFLLEEFLPEMAADLRQHPVFFPKTLFYYPVGLVMCATGFTVWAGALAEAIFGVLGVFATYLLTRELAGRRIAHFAAWVLALSCFHLYNSRTAYPQTLPVLFATLAFFAHARWQRHGSPVWLFLSGFLLGLGFWGGYQTLVMVPVLAMTHIIALAGCASWSVWARRCLGGGAALAAAFLLAIACAEASSYPMILLFKSQGLAYPHPTYLELNVARWLYHTTRETHWTGLAVFPYFLGRFEGFLTLPVITFLLLGAAWAGVHRVRVEGQPVFDPGTRRMIAYLAVPFLGCYVLLALRAVLVIRGYLFCMPFLAALVGLAVGELWRWRHSRTRLVRWAVGVGLVVSGVSAVGHSAQLLNNRSAYPEVADYIAAKAGRIETNAYGLVALCYWKAAGYPPFKDNPGPLYFIADLGDLTVGKYPGEIYAGREFGEPEAAFDQDFGRILLETKGLMPYEDPIPSLRWTRDLDLYRARRVLLYPAQEELSP